MHEFWLTVGYKHSHNAVFLYQRKSNIGAEEFALYTISMAHIQKHKAHHKHLAMFIL